MLPLFFLKQLGPETTDDSVFFCHAVVLWSVDNKPSAFGWQCRRSTSIQRLRNLDKQNTNTDSVKLTGHLAFAHRQHLCLKMMYLLASFRVGRKMNDVNSHVM